MTYKVTSILFILLAATLLLVACSPKQTEKTQAEVKETTTDQDITSLESDIAGIDSLNQDLDISELDDLDQELAAIEELELG